MKLSDFEVDDTAVLKLVDGSDRPMIGDDKERMTITFFGPGTKEYQQAETQRNDRQIAKINRKGKFNDSSDNAVKDQIEFMADCVKDISANILADYPDKKLREVAVAIFSNRKIGFVADQAVQFLKDWSNFTKGSMQP